MLNSPQFGETSESQELNDHGEGMYTWIHGRYRIRRWGKAEIPLVG